MIQVNNPAQVYLHDEKSVTLDGNDNDRIYIHPWLSGVNGRDESEVCIAIGDQELLSRSGSMIDGSVRVITIVDREDFVEAILAVFPELARA